MNRILPVVCVVAAAAIAGLLFAPVFGVTALLLPVGVVAAAMVAVCVPRVGAWRPLLMLLVGLLAVVETMLWSTTMAGVPTGATLRALAAGITESWQLALQSTWPARPEPELMLFVPLLVLLAGVLGVELLDRLGPLVALAPSLVVVVLSQLFGALSAGAATAGAVAYAVAAGALLLVTRRDPAGDRPGTRALLLAAPAVVLALVGAIVAGMLLPTPAPRYSLHRDRLAPLAETSVTSPLDELAERLTHPGVPLFTVRGDATDRWPLVVLTGFDGVNWHPGGRYRRLGEQLGAGPEVTVPVRTRTASIEVRDLTGPWLPSQTWPAEVRGVEPLVEEQQGSLVLPRAAGPVGYTLTWEEPEIDPEALAAAAIDPTAAGGLAEIGDVPPGVAELAERAVRGMRPTFQAALVLERYLRENYRLATGEELPTGHGWPQLADFLLRDQRGTSEQFAAAYVVLARLRGIPARLVVGFRTPANRAPDGRYTVRNGDVLAWPEVAVEGVGWVPLDPSGTATPSGVVAATSGLGTAAAQARSQLPAPQDLRDPPVAPRPPVASDVDGSGDVWTVVLRLLALVPLLVLVAWLAGVPAAKAWRASRRRRRAGVGAVVGAWEEVRDRVRAYGIPVSPGMTVRDLAAALTGVTDQRTVDGVWRLRAIVDLALWSGMPPAEQYRRDAWDAVRSVRRGLSKRGLWKRVRAALDPRPLLRS